MTETVQPFATAGAWGIVAFPGEASSMDTAIHILDLLATSPQPESAKIYQGTRNGEIVTYVAYKYKK